MDRQHERGNGRVGFLLALGANVCLEGVFDTTILAVLAVWLVFRRGLALAPGRLVLPPIAVGAAVVGILVHLLVASGIEMPPVAFVAAP